MAEPSSHDPGVLGRLPRSRPQRRSGRRASPGRTTPHPEQGSSVPRPEDDRAAPVAEHGLIGTATRMPCELARLGVTVGNQVLRGALSRLPRP